MTATVIVIASGYGNSYLFESPERGVVSVHSEVRWHAGINIADRSVMARTNSFHSAMTNSAMREYIVTGMSED